MVGEVYKVFVVLLPIPSRGGCDFSLSFVLLFMLLFQKGHVQFSTSNDYAICIQYGRKPRLYTCSIIPLSQLPLKPSPWIKGYAIIKVWKIICPSNPWRGTNLNISLNHSQTSKRDSLSSCLQKVILFLSFVFFLGGKYNVRNTALSSFSVVMEIEGKEYSQVLALTLRDNVNSHSQITSLHAPSIFKVSQNLTNMDTYMFKSSIVKLENYFCYTMDNK